MNNEIIIDFSVESDFNKIKNKIQKSDSTILYFKRNTLNLQNIETCDKLVSFFKSYYTVIDYFPSVLDGKLKFEVLSKFNKIIFHLVPSNDLNKVMKILNILYFLENNLQKYIIIECEFKNKDQLDFYIKYLPSLTQMSYLHPINVDKNLIWYTIQLISSKKLGNTILNYEG